MELETVVYDLDGQVGVIRLNRPERMNAVIEQMYLDLQTVLAAARDDDQVRALILTGSTWRRPDGDKEAFCAGADLKKHSAGERSPWQKRQYIFLAHETTRQLYEFSKPVIVAVNGPARGAGSEMALNGDFLLMADSATIGFPETGLATFVGGGVTSHLVRLVGMMKAKELVYTGTVLDGPAAAALGIALRSVPQEELLPEALNLARSVAAKAPISISFAKKLLQKAPHWDLETVLLAEAEAILACMNTEDWHEGVRSFAEKRQPHYEGR
ncbi:MAG: enoyl-CoA hydratase/isomerase family protein [Deltaproteobacteria bacterium]|nr:enoyl-CoA hydratase/isomerase family protein [Candidatus Anaeroferrophillus wilburensis]MBN2888715.1 enoyl-CoA hydratase/isomerase family protein [Deltaproteobacteria bacterium]